MRHSASGTIPSAAAGSPEEIVARRLERYAQRGIFRGYAPGRSSGGVQRFRLRWHHDQLFECVLDPRHGTLRFPVVLPEVPVRGPMDRALRGFVRARQSDRLPEHRRIDPRRATVRCANRGGDFSIRLRVEDGDYDYAIEKLIHLVHEVYLGFLSDGRYYDYVIETFDLDPDHE